MKWILSACFILLSGCFSKALVFDSKPSAKDGPEPTLIFIGCDSISKGYLFCPLRDGTDTEKPIRIIFPTVTCARDACITLQTIHKSGDYGKTFSLKRGENMLQVKLSDIIGMQGLLSMDYAGEYQVVSEVFIETPEQTEKVIFMRGLVRVWWLAREYQTLACNDPEKTWSLKIKEDCEAQWSTGGRSELCGNCGGL